MKYESLHTCTLEKLFGPMTARIIKQDKKIRIAHIQDKKGISRTLGVVRFLNVDGKPLKAAHSKILAGGLLGKTLYDSDINFDKEFLGRLQVTLPDWLKKDFNTKQDISLALFSKILIHTNSLSNGKFLYSEVIEVIPPDLKDLFAHRTRPLFKLDKNLLSLFKVADLTEVNERKSYD